MSKAQDKKIPDAQHTAVENMPHNIIRARGKLIGSHRNDYGRPEITLFIRNRGDKTPSYVKFTLHKSLPMDIRLGDYLNIEGEIRAFRYYDDIRKRNMYVQHCVANKITADKTKLEKEFGYAGFAHEDSYSEVLLSGKVSRVNRRPEDSKWTTLTILVENTGKDKRPSYINVQYSDRMVVADHEYHVGDVLCLWCIVYSRRKVNREGNEVDYENLIVNDIAFIERAEIADDDASASVSPETGETNARTEGLDEVDGLDDIEIPKEDLVREAAEMKAAEAREEEEKEEKKAEKKASAFASAPTVAPAAAPTKKPDASAEGADAAPAVKTRRRFGFIKTD